MGHPQSDGGDGPAGSGAVQVRNEDWSCLRSSRASVLVSDFYAAYSHYAGLKQRCWVHLLRDIDELEALYPQDTGLGRWATAVRQLYDRAKASADYSSPPFLTVDRTEPFSAMSSAFLPGMGLSSGMGMV